MADFEGVDTVCIDVRNLLIVLGPVVLSLTALIVVLVVLVVRVVLVVLVVVLACC